ncbi:hypothetical protein [Desulfurobacterium crinifex]
MCECEFYNRLTDTLSACLTRHSYKCPERRKIISCEENNAKFICKIEPNEIACLFVVDPQHEGNCRDSEPDNCLNSSNFCDFILFVNTNNSENPLKSVTFIELKGSDTNHAVKQIKETIKAFMRKFPKYEWKYKTFAVIIFTGSAPKATKDKDLKELLDKFPFLKKRDQEDITYYVKNL